MKIPNLRRIKVTSQAELAKWLATNADHPESVMLVTHCRPSSPNHVSREEVAQALAAHGWEAGPRFTLNDALIGHVIARRPAGGAR